MLCRAIADAKAPIHQGFPLRLFFVFLKGGGGVLLLVGKPDAVCVVASAQEVSSCRPHEALGASDEELATLPGRDAVQHTLNLIQGPVDGFERLRRLG